MPASRLSGSVARRCLAVGATVTAAALGGSNALADTAVVWDRHDVAGAHDIRRLTVDNTGERVGTLVRHRGSRWTGRVRLEFDVAGGPGPEFVATLGHGPRQRMAKFTTSRGSGWRCRARVARSPANRRTTWLSVPRGCLLGAPRLTVRAKAVDPGRRADTAVGGPVLQQSRPNIVMIMVDDMRTDELRYMPRTRRLIGGHGVRFANSFSPYPLCCPARASVLVGQYTHNHRVFDVRKPWGFNSFDDSSTLATWLRGAGYATVYLGKYLNGYGTMPPYGEDSGNSLRYVPPGWTDWRASIDGGLPAGHPKRGWTYGYFDTTLSHDGRGFDNYRRQYQSRVYGRLSQRIIRTRAAADRPFFLYASYTAPHNGGPREPDDPVWVVREDGVRTRLNSPARPDDVKGMFDAVVRAAPGADWKDPDFSDKPEYLQGRPPANAAERRAMRTLARQRAEALHVVDVQVKRTIQALAASGELEETLVIFTSDNGYFLGEQRIRSGKTLPHEPSLRVPTLMRGPGIPAGRTRYDPIMSIDLAPTIADLAGVRPQVPVDGVSMFDVAADGDVGWTRAVLTETGPGRVIRETDESGLPLDPTDPGARDLRWAIGIRTARYLYVDLASGEEELYDLAKDPEQYDNVADDPAYADTLALLRAERRRLRACDAEECSAPMAPELLTASAGRAVVSAARR